jgi:hypothetical protein
MRNSEANRKAAIAAIDEHRHAIDELIEKIQVGLKAFHRECEGNYAEAGSLAHWRLALEEISDSVNHEGEHA